MKKPSLFGKYLLLERLNVGGMAEVFAAKAFGGERVLAIKKILPTMAEDEEFIAMFIDEARISVQLTHPNIVHIHELGRHDDAYYIAMEYVSGKDLRALLERFHRRGELMPTAMAVFVATKICEGLDYAHRRRDGRGQELKIIHRDVSPQNILLSYEGEVKIIDFGIAKAANRSQKTQAGILKGKFGYMSPEQVRGLEIDHRSDIFAMGVIMYEMLTGEKLFVGESDFSTLEKVRNAEVASPREFNPEIPPGLEKVVLKALAREVADRYQWASDLQEDLVRFLAGDFVYSTEHLAVFMKEAFAKEVASESEKMERYGQMERYEQIDRPDQVEPSGPIARLPTNLRTAVPKRSGPPPTTSAPRAAIAGRAMPKGSGAGAVALGQQRSAGINIPPRATGEFAEMDASRDRTLIVAEGKGFFDDQRKTAIGTTPAVGADTEGSPRSSPTFIGQPAAVESVLLRSTAAATPITGLGPDTGHEFRPVAMTGFQPAQEDDLGDVGIAAPTTIGPSPFGHDGSASGEYRLAQGSSDSVDLYQTSRDHLVGEALEEEDELDAGNELEAEDEFDAGGDENPEGSLLTRRPPPRLPPEASGKPDLGRRALLIAIAVTGVVALGVLGVAMTRVFGGSRSSGIVLAPSPKTIRFSVTVRPGDRVLNENAKQVDLAPGEYVLDVRPSSDERYAAFRVPVRVREGKVGVVPLDFKASPRSTEGSPAPPPPSAQSGVVPAPPSSPGSNEVAGAEGRLEPGAGTSVPSMRGREPAAESRSDEANRVGKLAAPAESPRVVASEPSPPSSTPSVRIEPPPPEPVRPPQEESPRPPPPAVTWSANVSIDEPGVELFVDGRLVGTGPLVQVSSLVFGRTYTAQAKKAGFEVVNVPLENPQRKASINQKVEMLREDRGGSTSTKMRERPATTERQTPAERAPAAAPLSSTESRAIPSTKGSSAKGTASKGMGKLICTSDPVDAEVIIDGKPTGRRTPVPRSQPIELPFGKHTVAFRRGGKSSPVHEIVIGAEQQENPFLVKALKGEL